MKKKFYLSALQSSNFLRRPQKFEKIFFLILMLLSYVKNKQNIFPSHNIWTLWNWHLLFQKVFNNFDRPVEEVSAWFSPSACSVVSTYVCFSLSRLVPFSNTCFVQQMNVYFQQRLSSSSTQSHLLAMLGQQADRWKYYIYGFSTQHGKINKRH